MNSTIAIMQPYFLPYAGYFRLITGSDLFVIYDCVQFPRRGWVHRNKLIDRNGQEQWLTLPLDKGSQDILIKDLKFADNAAQEMAERLRPFPMTSDNLEALRPLLSHLHAPQGRVIDYLSVALEAVCMYLGFRWNVVHSSTLSVPDTFRGQERIIEIARRLGATRYLNAPGGRDLYDSGRFLEAGIELSFLPPYAGPPGSILQRLLDDSRHDLIATINDWSREA